MNSIGSRSGGHEYELIVIDELAYVAMPETAAELSQIIAGRAERAAVIVTTNLPFSEWTTMFPNARLCKAMLDRLTDQAHIIETGPTNPIVSAEPWRRRKKAASNDYEAMVSRSPSLGRNGGRERRVTWLEGIGLLLLKCRPRYSIPARALRWTRPPGRHQEGRKWVNRAGGHRDVSITWEATQPSSR